MLKSVVIYEQEVFKHSFYGISYCFLVKYPFFSVIPRHQGRIIYLKYEPLDEIKKTIGLVGKGITYDTGGADIKINGVMAGMSRDKCGAAAVAGLMQVKLN